MEREFLLEGAAFFAALFGLLSYLLTCRDSEKMDLQRMEAKREAKEAVKCLTLKHGMS